MYLCMYACNACIKGLYTKKPFNYIVLRWYRLR